MAMIKPKNNHPLLSLYDNEPIRLKNLMKVIPEDVLRKFRKIDDLKLHVPFTAGGITFDWDESPGTDVLAARMGHVTTVSNKPAMGSIAKHYDWFELYEHAKKYAAEHGVDLPPHLDNWQGNVDKVFGKMRGLTTVLDLIEQCSIMGPEGDDVKREWGPEPAPKEDWQKSIDAQVARFRAAGIFDIEFAHLVLGTNDSVDECLKLSNLRKKSSAQPVLRQTAEYLGLTGQKAQEWNTSFGKNIEATLRAVARLFDDGNSVNNWNSTMAQRKDRPNPLAMYADTDAAREYLNLCAKGRAIMMQSKISQLAEYLFIGPTSRTIQKSQLSTMDIRTPLHTSNTFESMVTGVIRDQLSYLIAMDESGFDHHMTPQGWYAIFAICMAVLKRTQRVGVIYSDEFVVFDARTKAKLESLAPGMTHKMEVRVRIPRPDGTSVEEMRTYDAEMHEIDTERYLRRVFVGVSGNDINIGPLKATGYKYIYDSGDEHYGKVQLGHGQRSGNVMTRLGNDLVNLTKRRYEERVCAKPHLREKYKQRFGEEAPSGLVYDDELSRGDDVIAKVSVDERTADLIRADIEFIPRAHTNLLTMTGGSANLDKQETSGVLGEPVGSLAQKFVSRLFPRGLSDEFRTALERMAIREEDEATGLILDEYDTDASKLLTLLGNWSRMQNLYGVLGSEVHPNAQMWARFWVELDVADRFQPPRDEEQRQLLDELFRARWHRRGHDVTGSRDMFSLWNTELGPDVESYYRDNKKLRGKWSPIHRYPEDARPQWRPKLA
jgi:hypothetical protein